MQVEIISRSWDVSGVCIIRNVRGGISYIQERSTIKTCLSEGVPRGQKLRMNLLHSKICIACFVLTSKQESK